MWVKNANIRSLYSFVRIAYWMRIPWEWIIITNGFARSLAVKQRLETIRKWPIHCVYKVTLHETIRNDYFKRNKVLQHCCSIVLNGYNIGPTLQRCVALKIVVANRPVEHHLYPHELCQLNACWHAISASMALGEILSFSRGIPWKLYWYPLYVTHLPSSSPLVWWPSYRVTPTGSWDERK